MGLAGRQQPPLGGAAYKYGHRHILGRTYGKILYFSFWGSNRKWSRNGLRIGPPGPPKPPKSTISGRPENRVLKTQAREDSQVTPKRHGRVRLGWLGQRSAPGSSPEVADFRLLSGPSPNNRVLIGFNRVLIGFNRVLIGFNRV